MRRVLATSQGRVPTGLCAACAHRTLSKSTPARAAALSSPLCSTPRAVASWPRPHFARPASSQRCLSTSPSPRRAPEPATDAPPSSSRPARAHAHAPLPYYALFPQTLSSGPPPTGPFSIDVRALRREFLQLQAASHPDFHHAAANAAGSSSSSSETQSLSRRKAEALSSHINSAYKTLSSPLLRAQYLLAERYGIDLAGDEASSLTGPPDPALLGEVMTAREVIEEARSEEDLEEVSVENSERIRRCLADLEGAFESEDVAAAVRETVRLRYWENIRESVESWEEGRPVILHH